MYALERAQNFPFPAARNFRGEGRGDPLLHNTPTITTLYALMYRMLFNLYLGCRTSERFPSGERLPLCRAPFRYR
jgi:hypothetical protein